MESQGTSLCTGMLAPTIDLAAGASASMTTPADAGQQTERSQCEHRRQREPINFVSVSRRCGARPAEESDAEGLDETGGGERGGERKQRADRGYEKLQGP